MSGLRVVTRIHAYPPDHNAGAEWMLHEMLRALVARGHRAEVWLTHHTTNRARYELDGVQVIPSAAGAGFGTEASGADVLVSHLESVPFTASLARGHGIPLIVLCHNTFDLTWHPLATGNTALAVLNSQWMKAEAEEYFHGRTRSPDRLLVVRPPVRAEDYRTRRGDSITLINCTRDKGAGILAQLAERMPDRKFLAVRGGYGEQQPPDMPNVLVLDHMPGRDMRDAVYARTRLLLMPSSYESWGRTGVEAMASGIPVLAHPTEGLAESLSTAGVFCDRTDIDAWQSAIDELDDPATYRAASRRATARAKQLAPDSDLDRWCDAVEEVCRARTATR